MDTTMVRIITLSLAFTLIPAVVSADDNVDRLVDQLVNVTEPGFGYSVYFSGSEFLPYDNTGTLGTLVLGAAHSARSETMRKLVEKGVEAVPILLKHLGDDRKINIKPLTGMDWMEFSDKYDFNRRTRKTAPTGVNRDGIKDGRPAPDSHAITVGDLCFVALGQIVNRDFSASSYQPTGGLVINSPTHSKRLRDAIQSDWAMLTREKHKQLLIDDFRNPDHEDRRKGAYLRLAFYYPETVEPLVLGELAKPTFDVFETETFCREQLYKTADRDKRKQLYDNFIRTHGEGWSVEVADQLFEDLHTLEVDEEHRLSPPLTAYGTQPRELLIQLFGKPPTITSSDRPIIDLSSAPRHARFIGTLTHDKSKKIGDVVKEILLKNAKDDYLATACLLCLANRGLGEFLVAELKEINVEDRKTDALKLHYLESISTSKDKVVRDELLKIIKRTKNDDYFMAALAGLDKIDDAVVLELATRILDGLPIETDQGHKMLTMIGDRFPKDAKRIYKAFLAPGSSQRAKTMCGVLWYGNPMSKEILAPLLDDKRILPGFERPTRVCDRAAQAISNATDGIKFDSEWSTSQKVEAIAKLKEYCRNAGK
jgi:hypothetical protein